MAQSKRFQLNELDVKKWVISAVEWLAPLGVIYFGIVAIYLQDGVSFNDFYNQTVIGAVSVYLVNQLYGLSKRFASGK